MGGVFMNRKVVIISTIFIMVLLLVNIIFQSVSLIDIEKSKRSGNDRWLQVENRILRIEERIEKIENIRGN